MLNQSPIVDRLKHAVKRSVLPRRRRGQNVSSETIVVVGMFSTANGIGESARNIYECLKRNGYSPIAVDMSHAFDQVDHEWTMPRSKMPPNQAGTVILVVNPPELHAALRTLRLNRWRKWTLVGYWAWELNEAPKSWIELADHVDEIWVPSRFVRKSLASVMPAPVRVVPIPFSVDKPAQTRPSADNGMKCLIMADGRSSFIRKNITGSIEIFLAAFGRSNDAQLTIKTRNAEEFPELYESLENYTASYSNIALVNESLDNDERWRLIQKHDVIISAHRAEGFGMHLAEAMAAGKTVLATDWSGNLQFMNELNSKLLPYQLVPVQDATDIYQSVSGAVWAEVDVALAAALLRQVFENPAERTRIAKAASDFISTHLNGSELLAQFELPASNLER